VDRLAGYEAGSPLAIVDPRGTSSECLKCDSKLEENGYRRLKCSRCGFEADRDVVGKLNIRKRALKKLRIKADSGGISDHPDCPPNDRCKPEQMGEQ
jgi:transposase